jgi:flavodoxin
LKGGEAMTTPLSKKDQKYDKYFHTERQLSNAGVGKNYDLSNIQHIIRKAILDTIPDAYNIIVGRRYYYFESIQKPTLSQMIEIGRKISLKSKLYKVLKAYPSKRGHSSTRVLCKTIHKNYNF